MVRLKFRYLVGQLLGEREGETEFGLKDSDLLNTLKVKIKGNAMMVLLITMKTIVIYDMQHILSLAAVQRCQRV